MLQHLSDCPLHTLYKEENNFSNILFTATSSVSTYSPQKERHGNEGVASGWGYRFPKDVRRMSVCLVQLSSPHSINHGDCTPGTRHTFSPTDPSV